ncbi:MAG TPA: sulfatase-like hydrolase/transferase [Kofleriaceae bacterium]|nr:sulfatase-like hydrolase/transferase [Kofleriaceae bacterium]
MASDSAPYPAVARPVALGHALAAFVVAGALAGLATGAVDALWSWQAANQFVATLPSKLRWLAFSTFIDGLAGAAAGAALGGFLLLLGRGTRLGDLARFALRQHEATRDVEPQRTQVGNAMVLVGLPLLAITANQTYRILMLNLAHRKNFALVVVSSMVGALVALLVTVIGTFIVARPVEALLAKLVARVPRARVLTSPWTPAVLASAMLVTGLIVGAALAWPTLRLLPLRGPVVVAVWLVFLAGTWRPGRRVVARLAAWRPRRRIAALVGVSGATLMLLVALVVTTGNSASTMKAASRYTGLGGPLARGLRRGLLDLDRDGYSRFFAGGDCDDGDASVHPGAAEIPDDGIDQNCIGGDTTLAPAPHELSFASLPPGVPADANIVLLTIDTTRADHLKSYGYSRDTMPNVDQLAAQGVRFANGWAHAPSTRYSMPAILTGRLPLDVFYDTAIEGWPGLLPRATTIAEVLKPLGFVTGAITNYWYFDQNRRMNQGFDEYDNQNARLHSGVGNEGPAHTRGSSSKEQTDKAIDFVTRHATQRFFLWVHYYDPHFEYERHSEVPAFGNQLEDLYDGELRFTDLHIGRLVEKLRAAGLFEKTIFIITGDHGEGFGEHSVTMHGYHLYQAQTKVPLIVRVPGIAPRVAMTPMGHVDILPTLANLAGTAATSPLLQDAMGRSMVTSLLADAPNPPPVLQQLSYEGNHEMRAAAGIGCQVIYNVSPDTSWEAYDTNHGANSRDIGDADACASTRMALARWYDNSTIPAGAAAALLSTAPTVAAPIDVHFGNAVTLLAVDVVKNAARGTQVEVTWTFAATATPPPGWKVFVHVEGTAPQHRFTGDHAPTRPLDWWRAGQYIRYTSTLSIPQGAATGTYTVWAGLWKGNARMPASSNVTGVRIVDNRVAVATIEVQ